MIRQCPLEVAPDIGAMFHGPMGGSQISNEKINAFHIMNLPVQVDAVIAAEAVLRNINKGKYKQFMR